MQFNYERLQVTEDCRKLVVCVYELAKRLPTSERYGLTQQLQRAATSILLNLAEGSMRSKRDFARFLNYSIGSLVEADCILKLASSLKLLDEPVSPDLNALIQTVFYKLYHLRESLK